MAQRIIKIDSPMGVAKKRSQTVPFGPPEDERTLKRINFDDLWNRMNWFVQLAQKPLKEMTEGEISMLQEEITAVQGSLFRYNNPPTFTRQQISRLQKKMLKYLEELIDKGQVVFRGLEVTLWVVTNRVNFYKNPEVGDEKPPFYLFSWLTPSTGEKGLLYELGQLLRTFGASVRRCPRLDCHKIFLQFRKNAKYCSRDCQSRDYMRIKRTGGKGK